MSVPTKVSSLAKEEIRTMPNIASKVAKPDQSTQPIVFVQRP
jgi:hypothetical protein